MTNNPGAQRDKKDRIDERIHIQTLSRSGVSNKEIARITGRSLSWVIEIANRRECECGNRVELGGITCARCAEIEENMADFHRSYCGVRLRERTNEQMNNCT